MTLERVLRVLWARRTLFIVSVAVCVTIAAVASALAPKKYVAELALVVDFKGSDPLAQSALSSPLLSTYIATQREIIASRNVALKVIDALGLVENPESEAAAGTDPRLAYVGRVLAPLSTSSSVNSNLIRIAYRADDPYTAARFANAFANAYIQTSLELQVDPAKRQAAWFDQQVQTLREDLARAQQRLDAYQRAHGVLGVDASRLDLENTRLQEISSQLVKAQAALVEAESRLAAHTRETPDLVGNALLQGLKSELARAEARLADLSQRVDRNHPQYKSAAAEVAALRDQLAAEVDAAKGALAQSVTMARQQVRELETALETQKKRIMALTQQRDELSVLQRDVESARAAYDAALQQANQSRLQSRIDRTNVAILNPATPPASPASPRLLLNVVLAFLVSSIGASGWIVYAELVRPRVRSNDDLAALVDLPVLAELPAPPRRVRMLTAPGVRAALPFELRPRPT
jgi:succinoglycan biosynthesis transport protein ExoP